MAIKTPPGAYVKELRRLRTRDSKTFDMGRNKRRLIKSLAPVHYKNRAGKLHTIDTTIRQDGDNFIVNKTDYDLSILADRVGYSYSSKRGGDVTIRLLELDGKSVKDLELNIKPRLDGDKFWYDEVLPGLDIYIEARPRQVQVWKIIKDGAAPHEFKWFVEENNLHKKFTVKDKTEGTDNHNGERGHGRGKRDLKRKLEIAPEREDFDDHFTFKETVTKRTAKKDKRTRRKNWVKEIIYPLLVDADIVENITADVDDGTEYYLGAPFTSTSWVDSSTTNKVGAYTATTTVPPGTFVLGWHSGVRFRTIPLSANATITNATLKINVVGISAPPPKSKIYGDDVDDAALWSSGNLPSGITKTATSVSLAGLVPGWNSLDVTAIVQEIQARPGWLEDNDMRFGLLNTGTSNLFYFYDYASGAANAAILEIDYWIPVSPIVGPPSHYQSRELSILVQDPLFLASRTYSENITDRISGHSHETRAQGGYYSATLKINDTVEGINQWFAYGLGRHIEIYNPGLAMIWTGFVNKISLNQGGRKNSIGPLISTANKILVRYSVLVDITADGAMGGQEATGWTSSTASQALNGIWEKEFSINGATTEQAEQLRDNFILDPTIAYPPTSMDFNLSGSGTATATLDCLGYWHFLTAYHYSAASGLNTNISSKMALILGADINGVFSTDYSGITANTSAEGVFSSGKETALTIVKRLVSKGDASDNPYTAGVYNGQRMIYAPIPTEIGYQWRGNRGVTNSVDGLVDPWDVEPGQWIFDPKFLIGHHPPITSATLGTDPRAGFIEVVKFSSPDGLSLNGVKLSQMDQILAKRGLGGM